jgi:threonine dehydrogenase-like Zn-dependent dehydrogenase
MGLLHVAALRGSGARIVVSEPDACRRAKALEVGAHDAIDPTEQEYTERVRALSDGNGASVTYVAVSSAAAIEEAVKGAAKRGVVSVYASVHPRGTTIQVDPNVLHHKEVVLTGSIAQDREDFMDAVWSIAHRTIDVAPLISAVYALEDLERAFEAAARPDTYRVFVKSE